MRRYVLDASAAIDLVRGRATLELPDPQYHAPSLIDIEFVHVLRKLVQRGELTADSAETSVTTWAGNQIFRSSHLPLLRRVWELRQNIAAYDASYVALAESLKAPLITSDMRLARTAREYCEVLLLSPAGS